MSILRRMWMYLLLTLLAFPQGTAFAQFSFQIAIYSPVEGDAVQGVVPVTGFAAVDGFISYRLEFSSEGDENQTWFQFASSTQPVQDGPLGDWDTTTLTDGNYRLKLIVFREGANPVEFTVNGLRVRNYSAIETDTPAPVETLETTEAAETAVPSPTFNPSPFAPNPAEISAGNLETYALAGGCLGVLIIGLAVLLNIQLPRRRRKR